MDTPTAVTPTQTIHTAKGSHTGTLIECLRWQATHQGAYASVGGIDISDLYIVHSGDPELCEDDLTPEAAMLIVLRRMQAELEAELDDESSSLFDLEGGHARWWPTQGISDELELRLAYEAGLGKWHS